MVRTSKRKTPKTTLFLNATATFWFSVAVVGQWVFVYYIISFYVGSALTGNIDSWNNVLQGGIIQGDVIGNLFLISHLLMAIIITVGGPLQIIEKLRNKYRLFHRWNGRIYIATAFVASIGGLYLNFSRENVAGLKMVLGNGLNAAMIMLFAVLALQTALKRNFIAHRRWAIRLFLVISGVWFMRIAYGILAIVTNGSFAGSTENFDGPYDFFVSFGHTLIPIAILEIYFRVQERSNGRNKILMGTGLILLTLLMAVGIFGAAQIFWLPNL
jgi:hypothetical protein